MRRQPVLNDVSTDLDDPPPLTWRAEQTGRQLRLPQRFKDPIRKHYGDVVTLKLDLDPDAAYAKALEVAREWPRWTLVREDAEQHTFEGYATTRILRFKDDFAVRVRARDGGSAIDMRSKSRIGRSDLGENAKRIRAFFESLRD